MATIRDVAQASGVSVSTVSIILNNKAGERSIPDTTVRRVREAMAELHYQPSRAARALRAKNERPTLALFWVLDNRSSFVMRIVQGLSAVLGGEESAAELVIHPYVNGRLCEHRELILSGRYQGIFVGAMNREDMAFLESLSGALPIYVLNRYSKKFPCCYTEPEQVGRLAADYALKRKCRSMAVVTDKNAVMPKTTRRDEVIAACARAGIACAQEHYIEVTSDSAGGMQAAYALAKVSARPDMVYLDNDLMAVGFSIGCHALGITDLPILAIGLSHPGLGGSLTPAVDLIDIPGERVGEIAAKELTDYLYRRKAKMESCVCPCVMMREQ